MCPSGLAEDQKRADTARNSDLKFIHEHLKENGGALFVYKDGAQC